VQVLVPWQGLAPDQATWEFAVQFEKNHPLSLEDRALKKGEVLIQAKHSQLDILLFSSFYLCYCNQKSEMS